MAPFKIDLSLRGSQNLYFIPVGKETYAGMSSPWDAPSFVGSFLPGNRTVNKDGFNASWKILHFNRNYPQQWTGQEQSFAKSEFGVYFLVPMDHYLKSLRSSKYSILVIALTFLVFFLVEIMMKQRIHPIQYVLVGLSLSLFYALLLSISEQVGFDLAYMISSIMIILLIYLYSRTIVKNARAALMMLGFLVLNYGFIYVIIQLEEYSLLVGSIGLFIALSITMFVTRKINWYGSKDPS
jgi:inner membrane protein